MRRLLILLLPYMHVRCNIVVSISAHHERASENYHFAIGENTHYRSRTSRTASILHIIISTGVNWFHGLIAQLVRAYG